MANAGTRSEDAKTIVTKWVNEYTDDLYAYAVKRVSHDELAKDLVQNTFLAAYQSYPRFKHQSKPKTWLTSILKNKIMDYFRQVYRQKETLIEGNEEWFDDEGRWKENNLPEQWSTEHVLDDPDFLLVFDSCLDGLPEKWGASVRLKYLEPENSFEDLGVTKANYWKILERARLQLRKCLESNWFSNA